MDKLTSQCQELYYGLTPRAVRARSMMLAVDIVIIAYFVGTTFLPLYDWIIVIDAAIGLILVADFVFRMIAHADRAAFLFRALSLIDLLVIASLFVPALIGNFAFLRVIRAVRLMRSYAVSHQLRTQSPFFARNEDVIFSALNLIVFIFVITAAVFVLQVEANESINNYVDALYFTVATLTTTGFGDIILVGSTGRLLAVTIMIVGVALFIRLVQTIFMPSKVRYECSGCGLTRHESDAVHCKHCGQLVHIRTEGIQG
ncbi:MAG: ion channel [Gammaproteobacteria bacterium]|nr:ion channel [Gammaproteobacteria bacterium]MDH3506651.1 ion channel [Gammaproteobacteria bacterium]